MNDFKKDLSNGNIQKGLKVDDIQEIKKRIIAQHKTLNSILLCLKTYDAKIDSLAEIIQAAGIVTEKDFEDKVDTKVGIRRKADDEIIALGDIVWVNYTVTDHLGHSQKDEHFILKVGTNSVIMENAVLGKPVNSVGIEYEAKYKDDATKSLKFVIDVEKVKVRLMKPEEQAVEQTPEEILKEKGVEPVDAEVKPVEEILKEKGVEEIKPECCDEVCQSCDDQAALDQEKANGNPN